ncbi:hypothetical protein UA08_04735 [Talaromyces atroroseus]|uniref:FAD-binding domain-containing protein n=1 Tax=Talaromyces atroroseus TaxID=1441469 RepID=A0A225AWR9_TALAT|nr:hypothetical protein UA08_04735 [Talaromyces atroroseus]OKL60059.1 hypothetical protein UA08_04735 [Talaromyces atroroseus]
MSKSLDIVIVGAGIGGLTLAIGLEHRNIPYTLYEAATQFSAIGAGVGLGPNALRAMAIMDPVLREMYNGISSGNLTPNKEHVAMDVMYAEEGLGEKHGWQPAPFGAECYERTSAHRKDLLDIMTSRINRERVRFGKRVDSVRQDENGVTITFKDGETVQADLLIGADGIRGPTRQAVLGEQYPDKVSATYSGKYVYRSIAPMKEALDILGQHAGDARTFLGPGVNFITYPISRGTEYNMVAIKVTDEPWSLPQWTQEVTREEMAADFEGVDRRIVKLLDWAQPLRWALWHHYDTPTYYNDRICLLGDSAHATTPHQASGAGQCIEDALVMSHLLGLIQHRKHVPYAFKVYDALRRPRAQKVVQTSQELGKIYTLTSPELTDMDSIVENLNHRFLWIWEHDIEGDLKTATEQFKALVEEARL